MVYRRAFIGEALAQSALVFGLLCVMLLLIVTARALADLAEIGLSLGDLALVVMLGIVRYAPLLVSFSVVAGLLATFDRMRAGRELLSWEIAGLRPASWTAPVLLLAALPALFCALMALEGSPWAMRAAEQIKRHAIDRAQIVGHAGAFGEIGRLGAIYHITQDRTVLIQQHRGRNSIILSSGQLRNEDGMPSLELADGRMYSARRFSEEIYEARFAGGHIAIAAPAEMLSLKLKSTSARQLDLGDQRHRAEFLWRIGLPLSLLALAVSLPHLVARGSRRARGASILLAVAGYWLFYSTMSLMKELAAQHDAGAAQAAGMVFAPVALVLAATAALALARRRRRGRPAP